MKKPREKHPPKLPDTRPGADTTFEKEVVYPVPPDTADEIRMRLSMFASRDPEVHAWSRSIAEPLGLPASCPRPRCVRARQCAAPFVTCFVENRVEILAAIRATREAGTAGDGSKAG